jgi:peptidoglycan/LPS O-acetylase OafA/YrhL
LSLVLKEINLSPGTYGGSPAEAVTNSTSDLAVPAPDVTHEASIPRAVDNTDWLKTVAIILVLVDHFGYFFMDNDHWWGAFGRMAAPTFFFLLGYSRTSRVPLQWIVLGVGLTLLDSSNNDWTWMPPNILLSFALIRLASPYVRTFVERRGWVAYATVALALVAVLPAAMVVDYGAEGWLWALFGLSQRMYVDGKAVVGVKEAAQNLATQAYARINNAGLMRLLICVVTAVVYVWQEQLEFKFSQGQLTIFIVGLGILCLSLCLFLRGPSRVQPPESVANVLRFIGRHTLEIYAIELIVFELIAEWLPDLTP